MAKLVEYITPTWIPEEGDECIPIYDPAIDGERIELVRCKYCKWRENTGASTKWLPCMEIKTNGNWFCADGERR